MASMNFGGSPRTISALTDPGAGALTRIPGEENSSPGRDDVEDRDHEAAEGRLRLGSGGAGRSKSIV